MTGDCSFLKFARFRQKVKYSKLILVQELITHVKNDLILEWLLRVPLKEAGFQIIFYLGSEDSWPRALSTRRLQPGSQQS